MLESSLTIHRRSVSTCCLCRIDGEEQTVFQDFVKLFEMCHDHISVLFEYCQGDEEVEVAAVAVCPQRLPQPQGIGPFELAFVPDKQHSKEEEEIGGVGGLKM